VQLWLFLAIALPVLAAVIAPMSTVDLAYQVRAGRLILDSQAILRTDPFTFTAGGQPWFDQQWGAQILLGLGYQVVGWAGLAVARAVVVGSIFGLVLLACRARGANERQAALLALASFLVVSPALGLRPQLGGMLCFALVGWFLATRQARPRRAWLLVLVVAIWANIHGSFFLGPAMVAVGWLDDVVAKRPARAAFGLLIGSLVATCLTPFGPAVWLYALELSTNTQVRQLVTEWQPTNPLTAVGAAFYASVIAAGALVVGRVRRDRRVPVSFPVLAWLVALVVLGATAERGIAWWALGAPVALAPVLRSREAPVRVGARANPRRPINTVLAAAIVSAAVALLPMWRSGDPTFGPTGLLSDAPTDATLAVQPLAHTGDRLLASQRWASWFEFAVPETELFVDSRVELFGPAVWSDYQTVAGALPGWQQVLSRWSVRIVTFSRADAIAAAIAREPGWRIVLDSTDAVVAIRMAP
jgi:hypothetical protein